MAGLTWLHLSDWHQKERSLDRDIVRDALLHDLRRREQIHPSLAKVDLVIFSGDVAWQGKAEEFQTARERFFEPVLRELGLPPNRLFIVPGNHDLQRSVIEELLPVGLQKPLKSDAEGQKWLLDETKRKHALEPFADFEEFISRFTGQKPAAYANAWSGFIGDKTVGILCLNSAWMCGRNKDQQGEVSDYGYLVVGEPQVYRGAEPETGSVDQIGGGPAGPQKQPREAASRAAQLPPAGSAAPTPQDEAALKGCEPGGSAGGTLAAFWRADVRLAVLHHPFEWLAEFDRNRIAEHLKRRCHFILHGHEHQPKFNLTDGLLGQCAVIPAGTCFNQRIAQDPRYTNACNFVHLDFDTGRGLIFLRRWGEVRKEWIEDIDSCPGGKFPFPLPKELGTPQPPATPPKTAPVAPPAPGAPGPRATPLSPAIQAYLRRLEVATAKLQLIGLGQGVQIELPIEQAYIPLKVSVARGLERESNGHFDDKGLRQRQPVEENVLLGDVFKWAKRFESRGVLLLGDPGAGKTTGARQFCRRVLGETDLPQTLGLPDGTLPVFLRLRQLTPQHLREGWRSFVAGCLAAATLPDNVADPGPDLLAHQGVLWILDGLDEVVNENARVHVCGWIKQAVEQRPDDRFLVTSRYQGYQGRVDLGPAFCEFHVQPLDPGQAASFVDHWYRAVCRRLAGPGDATDATAAQAAALTRSLMDLLGQPEYRIGHLRELPANPLLLTILCVVHHQDRNLPRRRADLYGRCVRVLLEHWRREMRELQLLSAFDAEAAESVLAAIAWRLHERESRTGQGLDELSGAAAAALADLAPGAGLGRDGVEFIRRMRDECGILAMWGAGQCGFLHLSFQEYLAGLHAAREGKAEALVKRIGQSWWREVILIAVGIGSREFASKFFAALLEGEALGRDAVLVGQCLDEAKFQVLDPFISVLGSGVAPARKIEVLRPLVQLNQPALTDICRKLAASDTAELASLAREVLARAKVQIERPVIEVVGEPLELYVDSRTGIAFITISAGEFEMGSETGDSDERPVHRVRISRPFRLGKYPVTNAEYQRFLEANPNIQPPGHWRDSQFNDSKQPVVYVSWDDAQAFCRWAGCRLPTEAEWEYACRAGSQKKYCFGDDEPMLGDYAWYAVNSGGRTQAVGQKKPNAWGLYDMHGNVWEWCADWFAGGYRQSPEVDPTGPKEGQWRVLRGGSWGNAPALLRCAFRLITPVGRDSGVGFRCVWLGVVSP